MDNQHKLISGYRDLSEYEIALINEIKSAGAALELLQKKVTEHVEKQLGAAASNTNINEIARLARAEPARWVKIGNTHFQEGLMALTRAVAQPSSY